MAARNDDLVDAILKVAYQLKYLGNGDASTPMGAIEAHGKAILDAAQLIADGLSEVAAAIREKSSD
jgi:hypothetical protein